MRLAFLLLVFANIAFFGYASHLSAGRGEAQLQLLQISPERVKLVKDVAPPPPPKPAPEARLPAPAACLAWGPPGYSYPFEADGRGNGKCLYFRAG